MGMQLQSAKKLSYLGQQTLSSEQAPPNIQDMLIYQETR